MIHLQALFFKIYCTYCLTVFCRTIAIGIPFLHYKTRANVYMVLGRGVVGSCLVSTIVRIWGGGFSVGKSSGCTCLLLWYALVSNFCNFLNHCIRKRFLVCVSCNVRVGVTELYLQISL